MTSEIVKRMAIEQYRLNRITREKMLNALSYVLKCAEDAKNDDVWFTTQDIGHGPMKQGIVIKDINALHGMSSELGSDFVPEYMLNGMRAATQDPYEGYCVSVLTTHNLNCATIESLSELIYRINLINR